MSMSTASQQLSRREHLRRVVLLCCSFVRNLAYYRVGRPGEPRTQNRDFWVTVNGNFIDMCVLEWCKLLGDRHGEHYWENVISDAVTFEETLLRHLQMTAAQYADYIKQMRDYRDKFIAHLDRLRTMDIPMLDKALAAVQFYHGCLTANQVRPGDLSGMPILPANEAELRDYYDQCIQEATRAYQQVDRTANS